MKKIFLTLLKRIFIEKNISAEFHYKTLCQVLSNWYVNSACKNNKTELIGICLLGNQQYRYYICESHVRDIGVIKLYRETYIHPNSITTVRH